MKIKNFVRLTVTLALSLLCLSAVSIPPAAAAAVACTWAGGELTGDFDNGNNWLNCGGSTPDPVAGDNLTFPFDNAMGTNFAPVNNLSSAVFGSLVFSGALNGNSNNYDITGNALTLTNSGSAPEGITNSGTGGNAAAIIETPIDFSNDQDVVINGAGNSVKLTAALTGTGALTLSGGGVLYLEGGNASHSGALSVSAGTLYLDGNNSVSAVTVASGSTLKGDGGQAASISVASGGTIAPGHSPGCLTTGSLTVNGTFQADIASATACSGYDQVTTTGAVSLTGATLNTNLLSGFQPAAGTSFTIIKNSGGSAITGTFTGLPEGGTFTSGGVTFLISYVGNSENDVVLTVKSVAASASTAVAAPKAPNTGLKLLLAQPLTSLLVSISAAAAVIVIARRLKPTQR